MEPFKKLAQELLDEITGMLSVTDVGVYTSLVNNLLAARNVLVAGEGRSRYVMGTFAQRLSRLGRMVTMHGEAVGRAYASKCTLPRRTRLRPASRAATRQASAWPREVLGKSPISNAG